MTRHGIGRRDPRPTLRKVDTDASADVTLSFRLRKYSADNTMHTLIQSTDWLPCSECSHRHTRHQHERQKGNESTVCCLSTQSPGDDEAFSINISRQCNSNSNTGINILMQHITSLQHHSRVSQGLSFITAANSQRALPVLLQKHVPRALPSLLNTLCLWGLTSSPFCQTAKVYRPIPLCCCSAHTSSGL